MQNHLSIRSSRNKESILSFWFAFSFILNGYASGIPGLSLGSVVFIILVIYSILHAKDCRVFGVSLFVLTLFICFSIIDYVIIPNDLDVLSILIGLSKYLIWAFMISYGSSIIFNKSELMKWMIRFSIVLFIYLIIQNISFYVFSKFLPNIIEIGPLHAYDAGYAASGLGEGFIIRPASFLSESSFLGAYFICTLIMVLVENQVQYSSKLFRLALLFTFAIFLSTSTSAMIMVPLIWFFLGSSCYKHNKLFSWVVLVGLIWLIITIVAVFSSLGNSDNALLYSFFYSFDKFERLESSTRFGDSYAFLYYIPDFFKLLGVGIGNEVTFLKPLVYSEHYYMNSTTMLLIQVGWLGISLFVLFLLYLIKLSIKYKAIGVPVLVLIYFILGFGSGVWLGTYGILFLFIACGYIVDAKKEFIQNKLSKQ